MKTEFKQSKMKESLFVAFATQKGGVGKSTFTTLMASWLHYTKGMDVAVVDCDHPQYSLDKARKREVERGNTDPYIPNWLTSYSAKSTKACYRF